MYDLLFHNEKKKKNLFLDKKYKPVSKNITIKNNQYVMKKYNT